MKKLTVGTSSDCDIVVKGQYVSRHHCILTIDRNVISIEDNNSTNGTYVDGHKVHHRTTLKRNSKVMLGPKYKFDFSEYVFQTLLYTGEDETLLAFNESIDYNTLRTKRGGSARPVVDIPSKIEINENHAEIYKNGENGADWKVPLKRNMGSRIGDSVGQTLGCIISAIIIVVVLAIVFAISHA